MNSLAQRDRKISPIIFCISFFFFLITRAAMAADVSHSPNPAYLMNPVFLGPCPSPLPAGMLPENYSSLSNQPDPWTFQPFASGDAALAALIPYIQQCYQQYLPACVLTNIRTETYFITPPAINLTGWAQIGKGYVLADDYCAGGTSIVGSVDEFASYCQGQLGDCSYNPCQLNIRAPLPNTQYPYNMNDTTAGSVAYQADDSTNAGQVNWDVNLEYATSGGKAPTQIPETFTSSANSSMARTYQSRGGRLTVKATENTASGIITACPANNYAFVVGAPIVDSVITARLISLYSGGATPNLLTGIATVESTYRQFTNRTLYGYTAAWPTESYDGGSHIGLMQMPTTMADAWDWYTNTANGANLFNQKIATAQRLEKAIRKTYNGLKPLSATELENMALVLYGPYANADLLKQYYVPQLKGNLLTGHKYEWVVNTSGNPSGVGYANSVRASVK